MFSIVNSLFNLGNSLYGVLVLTVAGSIITSIVIATFLAFVFKLNGRKKTKATLVDQYWSSKGLKNSFSSALKN